MRTGINTNFNQRWTDTYIEVPMTVTKETIEKWIEAKVDEEYKPRNDYTSAARSGYIVGAQTLVPLLMDLLGALECYGPEDDDDGIFNDSSIAKEALTRAERFFTKEDVCKDK
jgi:hypothetical protein